MNPSNPVTVQNNSYNQTVPNSSKKPIVRLAIFVVLGLLILGELFWAGFSLINSNKNSRQSTPNLSTSATKQVQVGVPNTLTLQTIKKDLKVNEQFSVNIIVSSTKATDGVDAVVTYDPNVLAVVLNPDKTAVKQGTIYEDYPVNRVDNGKVIFSGITSTKGGVVPSGILGTITFQAKTAGNTRLAFEFNPGSTKDSNIVQTATGQDILDKADGLEVNISP